MLITPFDLQNEPLLFREEIAPGAIDYAPDTRQIGPLPVEGKADLIVEHRGPQEEVEDIRVRASFDGEFDLLFRPEKADAEAGERAITEDETEIGYYGVSGLLLEDVVREQVLLSLPGRTLCSEDCKGLCAHCGQNLNVAPCNCARSAESTDPRWGALQGLKTVIK